MPVTKEQIDRDLFLYGNAYVQVLRNADGTERDRVLLDPTTILVHRVGKTTVPYGSPFWTPLLLHAARFIWETSVDEQARETIWHVILDERRDAEMEDAVRQIDPRTKDTP